MKGVMQRFTQWHNGKHKRSGTLWERRFKSVVVEDGLAARTMAAYIDLNPVREGMVEDPADYRWSGYGEAVGGGAKGDVTRPECRPSREGARRTRGGACGALAPGAWGGNGLEQLETKVIQHKTRAWQVWFLMVIRCPPARCCRGDNRFPARRTGAGMRGAGGRAGRAGGRRVLGYRGRFRGR